MLITFILAVAGTAILTATAALAGNDGTIT